eukprot:2809930-Pleurochrysis_carterae.AAC.2
MKPGGMHLAAMRSDGICGGHGLAPRAASLRILEPEMEMKSDMRLLSGVRTEERRKAKLRPRECRGASRCNARPRQGRRSRLTSLSK